MKVSPLGRLLFGVALVGTAVLLLGHLTAIDWPRFIIAFAAIDLGGYLPGALAFRRARGGGIAPVFHHLYNVTHSFFTAAIVIGAWAALAGFEWAMLAIPLHLFGDRALFGNGPKPASRPFEHSAEAA
jgi:hypothetical protein